MPTNKTDDTYKEIRSYIISAKQQIYKAVNSSMVEAYWNIGKKIYEVCGENDRAAYGKRVLKDISQKLTAEFGKGFDTSNLSNMKQFYMSYTNYDTVCHELSWSHYRLLIRIKSLFAHEG